MAYSKRSAGGSERSRRTRKGATGVTAHPLAANRAKRSDATQFELLNRGTSTAHMVRLALPPRYANLTIDGTSSRDLPSGKIKRTVDSIPYPPEDNALGRPNGCQNGSPHGNRKLAVREPPTVVIVSCAEIADAEELPRPRPPGGAWQRMPCGGRLGVGPAREVALLWFPALTWRTCRSGPARCLPGPARVIRLPGQCRRGWSCCCPRPVMPGQCPRGTQGPRCRQRGRCRKQRSTCRSVRGLRARAGPGLP